MKIVITIIITSVVVLFAMQNFDHIPIYFFSSTPVNIRLFFVICFSGVIGWMIRYITGIQREEALKKRFKVLLAENKALRAGAVTRLDEEDEF
ncbi:MAG: hypothetical protein MI863_09805 [Desulfobacterales bacterium]|nr:hypothetical protein [Desulfobacterales bacterium]